MSSKPRSRRVKVIVRIRPTATFAHDMIDLQPDGKSINIHGKRDAKRGVVNNQILDWSFKLDGILNNASQEQMYETCASSIVKSALDGYNGTIMCYGQTGAGKTFTMTGATENYKHRGLIPRALAQLYREIDERPDHSISIRISYLEIYNEAMCDLLETLPDSINNRPQNLTVVEDPHSGNVTVKGLNQHLAQTEEEALNLLFEGETNRAIAAHTLNKHSSRSHSRSRVGSEAKFILSKLNFVDLAGSERLSKTQSAGVTQQEAMYINKSLSFLEQTVIALADRSREHIPFRQTKLTHCLKDSIGGNCNTFLVANIWGEAAQMEETVSSLRFATRMMCVTSHPAVNTHYDPAIRVKQLEKEIQAMKVELAMHDTLANRTQMSYDPLTEQQRYEIKNQVLAYIEGTLDEIDIHNVRQITGVFEAFREASRQQRSWLEAELRSRYTLIDKQDPQAIAAMQAAGVPITDSGELVGDMDGQGYGLGQAPPGAKPAQSNIVQSKKKEQRKGRSKGDKEERISPSSGGGKTITSPTHSHKDRSSDPTPEKNREDRDDMATPSSSVIGQSAARPSTPPTRTAAFEEFKREVGSEINRILRENKEILATKKHNYADCARRINATKTEIDQCRIRLDQLRDDREAQGPMYNEDGETIISEEEFMEIKTLKSLKAKYKTDFGGLRNLKSEVQYCQKLVDQCRQKLIQEFDNWYSESFLTPDQAESSAAAGHGQSHSIGDTVQHAPEDEQEKFDRLQMELLLENPDSAAYYNAKLRTQRRKTFEGNRPVHRRLPGTPTRVMHQTPPGMMVQY